jgi:hypothetical protein
VREICHNTTRTGRRFSGRSAGRARGLGRARGDARGRVAGLEAGARVRIRERVAKLERFAGSRERRPAAAVVLYRGHLCCARLRERRPRRNSWRRPRGGGVGVELETTAATDDSIQLERKTRCTNDVDESVCSLEIVVVPCCDADGRRTGNPAPTRWRRRSRYHREGLRTRKHFRSNTSSGTEWPETAGARVENWPCPRSGFGGRASGRGLARRFYASVQRCRWTWTR